MTALNMRNMQMGNDGKFPAVENTRTTLFGLPIVGVDMFPDGRPDEPSVTFGDLSAYLNAFMPPVSPHDNGDGTYTYSYNAADLSDVGFEIRIASFKRQRWKVWVKEFRPRLTDFVKAYPNVRRVYRELGYPFGQNDGAFKRWCLTRSASFWHELENNGK